MDIEQENEDLDDEEDESVLGDNLLEIDDDERRMLEMAEA